MVLKVYISGMSGNKEVKKRQQRVLMIMDSKNIKYDIVDITEPGKENEKELMQTKSTSNGATVSDPDPRHPLPPQIFNDEEYCGDYDAFDLANEIDTLEQFLKLVSADTTAVSSAQLELKQDNGEVKAAPPTEDDENKENKEEKDGEGGGKATNKGEVDADVGKAANGDGETNKAESGEKEKSDDNGENKTDDRPAESYSEESNEHVTTEGEKEVLHVDEGETKNEASGEIEITANDANIGEKAEVDAKSDEQTNEGKEEVDDGSELTAAEHTKEKSARETKKEQGNPEEIWAANYEKAEDATELHNQEDLKQTEETERENENNQLNAEESIDKTSSEIHAEDIETDEIKTSQVIQVENEEAVTSENAEESEKTQNIEKEESNPVKDVQKETHAEEGNTKEDANDKRGPLNADEQESQESKDMEYEEMEKDKNEEAEMQNQTDNNDNQADDGNKKETKNHKE